MKKLTLIALASLLASLVPAAEIVFQFEDVFGRRATPALSLQPLSVPLHQSNTIVLGPATATFRYPTTFTVNGVVYGWTNGQFRVPLSAGGYAVQAQTWPRRWTLAVPDSTNTFYAADLSTNLIILSTPNIIINQIGGGTVSGNVGGVLSGTTTNAGFSLAGTNAIASIASAVVPPGRTNWPASSITNKIQLSQIDLTLSNSGVTNAICGWMPWWTNNGVVYSIPIVTNVVPPVVTPPDPDVDSFISRSGITNLQEIAAITTFVADLKTDGTWTNLVAIYPLLGGTAASTAVPIQSGISNIIWSGSLTYVNGVTGDGSTGYGMLPIGPGDGYGPLSEGQSVFCSWRINEGDMGTVLGAISVSVDPDRGVNFTGFDTTYYNAPYANFTGSSASPKTRTLVQSDADSQETSIRQTGIWDMIGTFSPGQRNATPGMTNHYALMAVDYYQSGSSTIAWHSSSTAYEVVIGAALTASQISTFTNAIAAFETSLGR